MHEIEDATERVDVNSRFHTMIAHYSGNERIVDYLAGFRERVNRDMYISSFNAVRTHDCDDEHDQIVDYKNCNAHLTSHYKRLELLNHTKRTSRNKTRTN